jgi:hypothetical protein
MKSQMWDLNKRDNQRLEAARLNLLRHIGDLQILTTKKIQQARNIAKENPSPKCRNVDCYGQHYIINLVPNRIIMVLPERE